MTRLNPEMIVASAFAPATCANVAVGFDILGFAVAGLGDIVKLTKRTDSKIIIELDETQQDLPMDPETNCAGVPVLRFCEDFKLSTGFNISIKKGIPVSSGLGGSAASSVAAIVACNRFLANPLPMQDLLPYALCGEEVASGAKHADNVIPALFGGFCLMTSIEPLQIVQLPTANLFAVLVHPHMKVETRAARALLKDELPLKHYVRQSANLAGVIAGLYQGNLNLIRQNFNDALIEPLRAPLVPGFYLVKEAAINAGAVGVSFSGSGPTMFALAENELQAKEIGEAMVLEFKQHKLASTYWLTQMGGQGAMVI